MKSLIALRSMTYNTRRLVAGDHFNARPADAKLLIAIKKAREGDTRVPGTIAPPPPEVKAAIAANTVPVPPATQPGDVVVTPTPETTPAPVQDPADAPVPPRPETDPSFSAPGAGDTKAMVEIPTNWRQLHWTQRRALAQELGAGPDCNTKDEADAFVAAAQEARSKLN